MNKSIRWLRDKAAIEDENLASVGGLAESMSATNQTKSLWYQPGIGLNALNKLAERYGKGWEDGVFHRGGINTGSWIVRGNKTGMRLKQILNLYDTEREFLDD